RAPPRRRAGDALRLGSEGGRSRPVRNGHADGEGERGDDNRPRRVEAGARIARRVLREDRTDDAGGAPASAEPDALADRLDEEGGRSGGEEHHSAGLSLEVLLREPDQEIERGRLRIEDDGPVLIRQVAMHEVRAVRLVVARREDGDVAAE